MTVDKLLVQLDNRLELLDKESNHILEKTEIGIELSKTFLKKAHTKVLQNGFENTEEEITFFKHYKPKIFSKLIYYQKLFNIESKRPRSSNKSQIKYFNNHIDRLQNYFNDNLEFYHYYRRGASILDEYYFVRGKADIRLFPDTFSFFIDDEFSTSHDSTVAYNKIEDSVFGH
ncbi:MAG: RteC domain-containing protein [Kordia sp.]|uniref:RteC domain-containing protein n=1 Tax=Kordia sp. TaxID=1965332 RepID=UPI00385DABCC